MYFVIFCAFSSFFPFVMEKDRKTCLGIISASKPCALVKMYNRDQFYKLFTTYGGVIEVLKMPISPLTKRVYFPKIMK